MNNDVKEIYISVDVESDGAVPGTYSMTALGAVVAGYLTSSGEVVALDVTAPENRFYAELAPISENWVPEAMRVGIFKGFTAEQAKSDPDGAQRRAYIEQQGENPSAVMTRFAEWVNERTKFYNAKGSVFAAYPLGFDWMWTYWYLVTYSQVASPFGHSKHIDIKTLYAAKADKMIIGSVKRNIPKFLLSKLPHTHQADQDAAEQGQLLMNLLAWDGK